MSEGALQHALVVGGTGMLAQFTKDLAANVDVVSVIARRARRIDALGHPAVVGWPLDYRKPGLLADAITRAQDEHGSMALAVSWIHGTAPHGHEEVVHALRAPARYVRILGSAAGAPDADVPPLQAPGVTVQDVVLGFVREGGRSRWLTHGEICAGVSDAVASARERTVVGTVEPWNDRP